MILMLVWGHREIYEVHIQVTRPVNENLAGVAYRLLQWDPHEERHFEHPFVENSNQELRQEREDNEEWWVWQWKQRFQCNLYLRVEWSLLQEAWLCTTIGIIFDLVHPFAPNRTVTRRKRYHRPSVISLKHLDFYLYSFNPLRILTSLLISLWFDKVRNSIDECTMNKWKIAIWHIHW